MALWKPNLFIAVHSGLQKNKYTYENRHEFLCDTGELETIHAERISHTEETVCLIIFTTTDNI